MLKTKCLFDKSPKDKVIVQLEQSLRPRTTLRQMLYCDVMSKIDQAAASTSTRCRSDCWLMSNAIIISNKSPIPPASSDICIDQHPVIRQCRSIFCNRNTMNLAVFPAVISIDFSNHILPKMIVSQSCPHKKSAIRTFSPIPPRMCDAHLRSSAESVNLSCDHELCPARLASEGKNLCPLVLGKQSKNLTPSSIRLMSRFAVTPQGISSSILLAISQKNETPARWIAFVYIFVVGGNWESPTKPMWQG